MKLQLQSFDYVHKDYLTYAENAVNDVAGGLAIYPHTMVKSNVAVTGSLTDITTLRESGGIGTDSYVELPQGRGITLGFKNADKFTGQIGEFSTGVTTADIYIVAVGEGASSKFEVQMQHPIGLQYYVTNADHTPGTSATSFSIAVSIGAGFDMKLYMESKITIHNNSTSAEYIRIFDVFFRISNTVKSGIQSKAVYAQIYRVWRGDAIPFRAPTTRTVQLSNETKDITGWDGDNVFATGYGRIFGRWIDRILTSGAKNRTMGKVVGDIVDVPSQIIESLLRDENFVERDLRATDVTDVATNLITIDGLMSEVDDYYNYAVYYNVSTNHKTFITDYDGATKVLTLYNADLAATVGSNIFITNIQGDLKIDYASFDIIGNTTNGLRGTTATEWIFARSYEGKQNVRDILSELCYQSHCELIESVDSSGLNKFKLIAIDSGSGDTWATPSYSNGLENISLSLTPLENVYTQYRLRYSYDPGKGDYTKSIYLDKNSISDLATVLSSTEQTLCSNAEINYKVRNLYEYQSRDIYDIPTAERFLQKKIQWLSKQRLIVNYITPIIGSLDWIKYEIGDQVKINFSQGIPTGLNNSSMFMISGKRITPLIGGGHISWELIEL